MSYNIEIENDDCKLSFHRHSIKGMVRDYIITFIDHETNIELIITDAEKWKDDIIEIMKACLNQYTLA